MATSTVHDPTGRLEALRPAPSRLAFGAMTFGEQVTDVGQGERMVARALDGGVTMFDTADSYHDGRSEELLGRCLRNRRDEVLIASKVGRPVGSDPQNTGLHPERIRRSVDESLRRLGTDHLDVYYLHEPDLRTPPEASLEALSELVDEGKVRVPAVSNHAAWQIADLDRFSETRGWHRIGMSQVLYNVLGRRLEDEYAAFTAHRGLFTIVYNPLAGGLLTGKHRLDRIPESGRFSRERYRNRYWSVQQFRAVERLGGIAAESGLSVLELAFRWLLSQPVVDAVLLGASSEDQLTANLEACAGGPLAEDVLRRCDDVWLEVAGTAFPYNR